MSRKEKLTAAEIKFKPLLEDFFIQTWGSTLLYSHDIEHHRRVWKYARELFLTAGPDDLQVEKLLLASYFHDLGMATDRGERHGSASMELCKSFLEGNNMDILLYSDVLDAVANHDDKEYKNPSANSSHLLRILSAADDLDAFGHIGVYRYFEIYLARGIDPGIIGHEIIRNASVRFTNFESGFGKYLSLVEKHKSRFLILHNLIVRHNRDAEIKSAKNRNGDYTEGLVQLVTDMIKYNIPPGKIKTLEVRYADNKMVTDFVEGLTQELSE